MSLIRVSRHVSDREMNLAGQNHVGRLKIGETEVKAEPGKQQEKNMKSKYRINIDW